MKVRRTVFVCCFGAILQTSLGYAIVPDRIAQSVDSGPMVSLPRSVHPRAQADYDRGPVASSFRLSYVTLVASPSSAQQQALNALLAQQQDPASANYHHWLTPDQYADRFGLSPSDISKVTGWLKSQGFQIVNVARGRNWITFAGTASQIEKAFQTQIHRYNVDGEMHIANASAAKIPAEWSGVITGLRGLNDFRLRPLGIRRNSSLRPLFTSPGGHNVIAPGDIATIYDITPLFNAGFDGTGQSLAVVGQTDVFLADINFFRNAFGLTPISGCTVDANGLITACNAPNFQYVLVGPESGAPSSGDLEEADLDLEWAGAVARNAEIIYVNAPATAGGVIDALVAAINPPSGPPIAPVISISYGNCEVDAFLLETELQQANAEGVTVINSSGDVGSAGCDFNPLNPLPPFNPAVGGLAVSYPASSPEVTGVGGTHIPLSEIGNSTFWGTNGANGGSALSYIPEVAWNDDTEIAQFCIAHPPPAPPECTPSPGVKVTSAQAAQADFWIASGGGGPSNCFTETPAGVCTGGFPVPAWQTVNLTTAQPTARFVPDVSLLASANFPGYVFCTPLEELMGGSDFTSSCANGIPNAVDVNFSIVGGTSASAPVFAGMVTLLNQYLSDTSAAGLGNINPMLYMLAKTPSNNVFHQPTSGNNKVYCAGGTPSVQPASMRCPGAVNTTGVVGYDVLVDVDTAAQYNLVTGLGSVDANNLAIAWDATRSATTTAVSASPTQIDLGATTLLAATVSPSSAVGVVDFFNNGSPIGTASVNAGGATMTAASLPLGANNITATYRGDGKNKPSTTATAAVVNVVQPDFAWAPSGGTAHTVLAGQTTLAYNFTAMPAGGANNFGSNVTFACSNLPDTTATCVFDPASIGAGAGATSVALTITTKGPNTGTGAFIQRRAENRTPWLPFTFPIAGMVMVVLAGRRASKRSAVIALGASLVLLGLLMACGGSSSPPPPVSVTVSLKAGQSASLFPNNTGWPAQTAQFQATVLNSTNQNVTWSVMGGDANGTIDANGIYRAPTAGAGLPASATIVATAQADTSKTAQAVETLLTPTKLGTFNVAVTATESSTQKIQNVSLTVN